MPSSSLYLTSVLLALLLVARGTLAIHLKELQQELERVAEDAADEGDGLLSPLEHTLMLLRRQHSWQTPGCHRVGHTRRISIPDCVEFDITTNACRGFCESWSVLSTWQNRQSSSAVAVDATDEGDGREHRRLITSVGQCCNIMTTEDVKVMVMCVGGPKELVFKSAKTCSCFHCKKY